MKKIVVSIFLLMAMLLSGCSNIEISDPYLNVAISSNVITLNAPEISDEISGNVIAELVEGLMRMDENGMPIPGIAESYELSDDKKTYVFHIRKDAKWSNGFNVTASDFVYAYQKIVGGNYSYTSFFADGAHLKNASKIVYGDENGDKWDPSTLGVSAIDDKTLKIELDVPVPYFLTLLSFSAMLPLPQKYLETIPAELYGTSPDYFVSNGPFVLEDYIPGTCCIKLKKNDLYYDASNVELPGINFRVITSRDVMLQAYEAGSLDVINLDANTLEIVNNDPDLQKALLYRTTGSLTFISINFSPKSGNLALQNSNFRNAIAHSFDRSFLLDQILADGSAGAYRVIPSKFSFNLETGEDFSEDQQKFIEYTKYDPELARKYIKLACEELNTDHFDVTVTGGNSSANKKLLESFAELVESTLPQVNIIINVVPGGELFDLLRQHDFEMGLSGWNPDYPDPLTFFNLWYKDSSFDYGMWKNKEYDDLIYNCSTGEYINDYNLRWNKLMEAEELILKDQAIIPLFQRVTPTLISPKVKNIVFHTCNSPDYSRAVKEK